MSNKGLKYVSNIQERLPQENYDKNVKALQLLCPKEFEDSYFITGLEKDTSYNVDFIRSEVNRNDDSYRSPFTYTYYPNSKETFYVSRKIRKFEDSLNLQLGEYATLYFDSASHSAFVFERGEGHLKIYFFIKKDIENKNLLKKGFYHTRMVATVDYEQNTQKNGHNVCFRLENYAEFFKHFISDDNVNFKTSGMLSTKRDLAQPVVENPFDSLDESLCVKLGNIFEQNDKFLRDLITNVAFKNRLNIATQLYKTPSDNIVELNLDQSNKKASENEQPVKTEIRNAMKGFFSELKGIPKKKLTDCQVIAKRF